MARAKSSGAEQPMPEEDEGHPLFMTEDGDDPPRVEWIQIRRCEPGGGWVTAPVKYRAHDLASEEEIHRIYGGGVYELFGRAMTAKGLMGPITARRSFTLAGKSKPLVTPSSEDAATAEMPSAPLPFQGYGHGGGNGGVDVASIIGSLQSTAAAQSAQQIALFTGFMQQQSALFQAQISGARGESERIAQLAIEQQRSQSEMFRMQAERSENLAREAMRSKPENPNGNLETTLRMMDLLERRINDRVRGEAKKEDDGGEMTGQLIQMAGAFLNGMAHNSAAPLLPSAAPVAAPQAANAMVSPVASVAPSATHGSSGNGSYSPHAAPSGLGREEAPIAHEN